MREVYLLTGRPGTGKTSLIKETVALMKGQAGGFYTEEIRSRGTRQGFRLVTLGGEELVLAHIDIRSRYRVSKYGVDVDGFERVGVPALDKAARQCDLVVIDEIGKMELFSADFRELISRMIESGKRVLGTIMLAPNQWADAIKLKPQVNLITITRENYHQVREELLHWLRAAESLEF